jgi:glucosamine--fructose-6-phosphate aminotransferase (isomerizing)
VHNAHPHFSHGPARRHDRPGRVALVHNGIIENHDELRAELQAKGYVFASQTDTEVIAHLVDSLYDGDLFDAVQAPVAQLHGAYAIAVFCTGRAAARGGRARRLAAGPGRGPGRAGELPGQRRHGPGRRDRPDRLPGRGRRGRPAAGQVLDGRQGAQGGPVQRPVKTVQAHSGAAELGPYRHYMQKEIFEQPRAIADTLEGVEGIVPELFEAPAPRRAHGSSRTSTRC